MRVLVYCIVACYTPYHMIHHYCLAHDLNHQLPFCIYFYWTASYFPFPYEQTDGVHLPVEVGLSSMVECWLLKPQVRDPAYGLLCVRTSFPYTYAWIKDLTPRSSVHLGDQSLAIQIPARDSAYCFSRASSPNSWIMMWTINSMVVCMLDPGFK